jgi:signal transduction histidine kinase
MKPKSNQTSILSYWTLRYLIILCVGFLLVSSVSIYWIRYTTKQSRLQITELIGQEIADKIVDSNGKLRISYDINRLIEDRERFFKLNANFCVIILDSNNKALFTKPMISQEEVKQKLTDDMRLARQPGFFAMTTPVSNGNEVLGQVILLQAEKALTFYPYEYQLLAIMLLGLAGFGWLTIYLLSRKLSRPVREVAAAAHAVSMGNYDIQLSEQAKEREISEMIVSFKEMASRLKQLEEWRAMMLAGVTHELKTPVTSIKGLVHAVREGVVSGEEGEEFLDCAIKETERLQCMIADLLDYNEFATHFVEVRTDVLDAHKLVSEIVYQWNLSQPEWQVDIEFIDHEVGSEPIYLVGDGLRIQQILVNLLNNSKQAKELDRGLKIEVSLHKDSVNGIEVSVKDNGQGIPADELPYVFERFFRGEAKKQRVRGLGLGLTFSRMLAQAQGGDLLVKQSSSVGSEFVLRLPVGSK